MKIHWSKPVPYDLTRTSRRASVPKALEDGVPQTSGVYAIFRVGQTGALETILDIGECGPQPKSSPHGLRGRLATSVAHSASQRMAVDIGVGKLSGELRVVWFEAESKSLAKDAQDALASLFKREYGRQPEYNAKREDHPAPRTFEAVFEELKVLAGWPFSRVV